MSESTQTDILIRPAQTTDVPRMSEIVTAWAEKGVMLHRSHAEFYERLRDFIVAEINGQVIGLCGLRIMWSNLAEVYGLALAPEARGKGLGSQLVTRLVEDAESLKIRNVFALTYEQHFFERLNFKVVDRMNLPMKVWSECARCPKKMACDEIAVIFVHKHLPEITTTDVVDDNEYEAPRVSIRIKGPDDHMHVIEPYTKSE